MLKRQLAALQETVKVQDKIIEENEHKKSQVCFLLTPKSVIM
jgi:hypothetical protein